MAAEAQGKRTLLFGDDRSQGSDVAWLWVVSHPWPGWRVEVVTAVPGADVVEEPEPVTPPHPRSFPLGVPSPDIVHEQVVGDPPAALAALTGRDLTVVGPRGGGLGKRLRLGSVSERLLIHPPGPVLIVRHGQPTRRALVCADGSAHAALAAQELLSMPWIDHTTVHVIVVPEDGIDPEEVGRAVAEPFAGVAADVTVIIGSPDPMDAFFSPRSVILDYVEQWDPDLLVAGTQGLSPFKSMQAGSIATLLAEQAKCSVLLAQAEV